MTAPSTLDSALTVASTTVSASLFHASCPTSHVPSRESSAITIEVPIAGTLAEDVISDAANTVHGAPKSIGEPKTHGDPLRALLRILLGMPDDQAKEVLSCAESIGTLQKDSDVSSESLERVAPSQISLASTQTSTGVSGEGGDSDVIMDRTSTRPAEWDTPTEPAQYILWGGIVTFLLFGWRWYSSRVAKLEHERDSVRRDLRAMAVRATRGADTLAIERQRWIEKMKEAEDERDEDWLKICDVLLRETAGQFSRAKASMLGAVRTVEERTTEIPEAYDENAACRKLFAEQFDASFSVQCDTLTYDRNGGLAALVKAMPEEKAARFTAHVKRLNDLANAR